MLIFHNIILHLFIVTLTIKLTLGNDDDDYYSSSKEFTSEWISTYDKDGTENPISWELNSIANYQPHMPYPNSNFDERTNCPHLLPILRDWNDNTLQWPFRSSSQPEADGKNITLPDSTAIIIRSGMLLGNNTHPYGRIIIPKSSRLIFDDTGHNDGNPITLHTLGIEVNGALEAGSSTCRLRGTIEITLHGTYNAPIDNSERHYSDDKTVKSIIVTNTTGARWDFHGELYHPTWTRLAAPIPGNNNNNQESTFNDKRNTEVFLQHCVNWPSGGKIVVTTSHVKDTRSYNYNEENVIAPDGVECVTIGGNEYGKITLQEPFIHYHHAGEKEYQCEIFLLSRNIVIKGNDFSEPIDDTTLECPATQFGYTTKPCPATFLTGFGGHTIIIGK